MVTSTIAPWVVATTVVFVSPSNSAASPTTSTFSDFIRPPATTTTTSITTCIVATPGETVVLAPAYSSATSSVAYTPTFPPTQTYTVTEYDVLLENSQGKIWTELAFDTSPTDVSSPNSPYVPDDIVFVVPYSCSGWSCWSTGQKAGLIVGVVCGAFLLLLLLCCVHSWRKRKIWISHGAHGASDYERWQNQNSHPGWGYFGQPQTNLHTGWGLRPYVTPAQAEAALRGGAPAPATLPATPAGGEAKETKTEPPKGTRQMLARWIAG